MPIKTQEFNVLHDQYNEQYTDRWVKLATSIDASRKDFLEFKEQSGSKSIDYKQRIRDGTQAATPYSMTAYRVQNYRPVFGTSVLISAWDSTKKAYVPYTRNRFDGVWLMPHLVNSDHISGTFSSAEATALRKAYAKIRSEYQRLNSAAAVAEFGDVIRQFGKPFDAIVDLTNRRLNRLELERRGLKGSTAFKRIKWAEVVASSYLEYAFGLSPLISDTAAVAEALAKWQYEKTGESRFRAKISARGTSVETALPVTTHTVGTSQYRSVTSTVLRETTRGVNYTVGLQTSHVADFGSNARLQQILGFEPRDWLPAAWEVVPWSWLIDYFTNVGDIIDAGATSTAGVTWIVRSEKLQTIARVTSAYDDATTRKYLPSNMVISSVVGSSYGSYESVRTTLNRSIPLSLGIPPLVFEHPFGNLKKVANMAAVLVARRPSSSALWLF